MTTNFPDKYAKIINNIYWNIHKEDFGYLPVGCNLLKLTMPLHEYAQWKTVQDIPNECLIPEEPVTMGCFFGKTKDDDISLRQPRHQYFSWGNTKTICSNAAIFYNDITGCLFSINGFGDWCTVVYGTFTIIFTQSYGKILSFPKNDYTQIMEAKVNV